MTLATDSDLAVILYVKRFPCISSDGGGSHVIVILSWVFSSSTCRFLGAAVGAVRLKTNSFYMVYSFSSL